jgi:hypothetical protein
MNEHVQVIQDLVFHSYPYNRMGFKPDAPHAEDCEGCRINAEVKKLVRKLEALEPVETIVAELKNEKAMREALLLDRRQAFEVARVPGQVGGRSITDLVGDLVDERNRLTQLLKTIKSDVNNIAQKLDE